MTELLNSVKTDLLDRRRLPLLILLAVALAAAVAYAVLGGGSSGNTPTATVAPAEPAATGIAVTQAPATNPTQPVAETTDGVSRQHRGIARNPFAPQPSAAKVAVSSGATGKTSGSSSTGTGSSSSSSSKGTGTTPAKTTPAPQQKTPKQPTKPTRIYHVSVLFGVAPAPPAQSTPLTPYDNLKRLTPLPSAQNPLVVFRGVTAGGKSATFTVVGETILRGNATCLPSASQCQAIDLKPGQTEQLEYLPPSGPAIVYQLQAVGITSSEASGEAATRAFRAGSKTGRELLRHAHLMALPGLRYSLRKGVLVFAAHRAFGARAHSGRRH
ncbi:MAG TPA: hypothetical protein VGG98_10670 [Solirubrobacteraceae bacterium]|jgi:hypothetical protein